MSYRYGASYLDPGLNTLVAPTGTTIYPLYVFGLNNLGQLGIGNTTNYSSPKQVTSLSAWSKSVTASNSSFGIKSSGTLWAWGNNFNGNLGFGTNSNSYSSPKQVGALTNWLLVSGGYGTTAAIKTDGTLWTWGANGVGQLGLSNRTYYSSPKQVGALTNWSIVSSSDSTMCAIKTDGTLWTWGYNGYGQLGLGNRTNYSSPKQVGALTNWSNVLSSNNMTMAIKTDGTLWSWGINQYGQLGQNNTTNLSSPKQVGSLTNWSKLSTNGTSFMSAVIKTDGTLWMWGDNQLGQLGIGNITYYSSPKQVGSLTSWLQVTSGNYVTLAIQTNGTLWSWGGSSTGSSGLGTTTYYSSPKQVGSLTSWTSISSSTAQNTIGIG